MIVGIGVDILHLPRLRALVSRRPNSGELLARRILSPGEVAEFRDVVDSGDGGASKVIMYLASRWVAKEAAFKALYPRHRLTWKEVTMVKLEAGKPYLLIDDAAKLGITGAHVSISHDGEYAIAQVLLEGREEGEAGVR
ncbi:4'-phosphopantetheinyl transferase [Jimgerdemannia flammicorona]|uniref:4'-phosphopantetheinyl transferase n=1 Tax=Jimgerdemannia flammicorona TaxID=994334 RepID=A0A433PZF9_9FUNG|nr:4'-phosphopantetheinyl transferase [Jimgerdemannia flammicorona]